MSEVRIRLCGRLSVEWDGESLEQSLPGRQGRLLFTYLALNRERPVRRDELVEALWADDGLPKGGETLLAPPLSRLRKALGPGRLEGRGDLSLALPPDTWIDWEAAGAGVERAQAALGEGDARTAWDQATTATEILDGGLVPGLEAGWIEEHRGRLEELRLLALEATALAGARLGGPELARAERAARAAVDSSPYRESARAALIEVLRAQGNLAEALRVFEELRVLLREELGTAPAPELLALHERLLAAGEPEPQPAAEPEPAPAAGRGPVPIAQMIDPRVAETKLVGRDDVLEKLRAELDKAVDGELRLALLAGEGGIGKTRLAAELAASRDDISVVYGRCDPEDVRPFGLWSGLLRTALKQGRDIELSEVVGPDGPTLARILPELVKRLDLPAPGAPVEPESERQSLFGAVVRLLGRLSARRPMLVILDDLHWADRSTLLLLRRLAGDDPPKGVLALGVYRDTELPEDSPLLGTLVDLQRHRPAIRLRLEALDTEEVRDLVGERVSTGIVPRLHDQAGGNPFFIEQMVRHLEETGESAEGEAAIPAEVRDVMRQRVSRLPEGGVDVLRRAALIGRDFDLATLADISPVGEDEVIDVLEAAVSAGLIDESKTVAGRFSFVHALLRDSLTDELSLTRRARVHRMIGESIERRAKGRTDRWLGALAWHFGEAGPGEADRTVSYSTRAAEQATQRLAYDEAVSFYDTAIEALRRDEPVDHGELAKLLLAQADARWRTGDPHGAEVTFTEAADAARRSGLPELLARAALGSAWGSWDSFDTAREEQTALLEEAAEALPAEDSPLRAQVLANLAQVLYFGSGVTDRARELAAEAERITTRLEDPATRFSVLTATSFARWEPGRLEDRIATAHELVEIAEGSDDPEDLAEALAWRSLSHLSVGRREEADADRARHAELAASLPQLAISQAAMDASTAFLEGRWEEGERIVAELLARDIPSPAAVTLEDALHFMVRAEQGRLPEHVEEFQAKAAQADGWEAWPTWRVGLLLARLQAGETEQVRREAEALAASDLKHMDRFNITHLPFMAVATAVIDELDHPEIAEELLPLLHEHSGEWVITGPSGSTLGPIDLHRATLLLLTDRVDEAIPAYDAALETTGRMRAVPLGAHARLGMARALRARGDAGDGDRAGELEREGEQVARRLGMEPLLRRHAGRG